MYLQPWFGQTYCLADHVFRQTGASAHRTSGLMGEPLMVTSRPQPSSNPLEHKNQHHHHHQLFASQQRLLMGQRQEGGGMDLTQQSRSVTQIQSNIESFGLRTTESFGFNRTILMSHLYGYISFILEMLLYPQGK